MKKNLLAVFSCIFTTLLISAQPVITAADRPAAGDIFNYQQVKSAGVLPGLPGANRLWDYSGLVDSGSVRLDSFLAVGGAPNVSLFPGTNLVEHGAGTSDNYNYYLSGTTSFGILGSFTPGDTTYFTPAGKYLNFPFTFGSFFTDSSLVSLHSAGLVSSLLYYDSVYVTGFGTLQLPGSMTYSGVLQVREERTFKTFLGQIKTITLSYLTPGVHAPLLTASNSNVGGAVVIEYLKNYIIIVPLKWLDISARISGKKALLNWSTSNEINTSSFSVEKSKDAVHFESFKEINISADLHSYSATDDNLQFGQTYYRIRQTDKDGKFSYSPVTAVSYGNKLQLSVTPNLVRNQSVNLAINSAVSTKAQIKFISIDGKSQLTKLMNLSEGYNQQQIDISALAKGIYLVELSTGSERQVTKIVKQ